MSSGLGVSSESMHPIVPPPSLTIEGLPQELLNQIFRKLGSRDLQAAACVSWSMNCSVIAAAHFHEPHSIKNFIKSLLQKLPEQKERLAKIAQNRFFQNCANLQQLKRSILGVRTQLIGVIKTIDEERAKGLHDVRLPHFFENIFTLVAIEKQIDEADLIPNEDERGNALREISQALIRAGDIDRSLEVATSIPNESIRVGALRDSSEALTRTGNMERALAVARLIPREGMRGYVLGEISKALAKAGNIDKAIAVVTSISDDGVRGRILGDISKALARAGNIDGSLVFVTSIPAKESARGWALGEISKALAEAGNIDSAIALATSISNEWTREVALKDIFKVLIQAGDRQKALAVVKLISSEIERGYMLERVYASEIFQEALTQAGDRESPSRC